MVGLPVLICAAIFVVVAGAGTVIALYWKVAHGGVGSWTDLVLAFSSVVGTFGLLGTLWIGYLQLRRLQVEQDRRNRPWLRVGPPHFQGLNRQSNQLIPFSELFDVAGQFVSPHTGNLLVTVAVDNVGALPAYDVTNAWLFGVVAKTDILAQTMTPTTVTSGIYFPGEKSELQVHIPYDSFARAHDEGREFRIRVRVLYREPNGKPRWTDRAWSYRFPGFRDDAGSTDDSSYRA